MVAWFSSWLAPDLGLIQDQQTSKRRLTIVCVWARIDENLPKKLIFYFSRFWNTFYQMKLMMTRMKIVWCVQNSCCDTRFWTREMNLIHKIKLFLRLWDDPLYHDCSLQSEETDKPLLPLKHTLRGRGMIWEKGKHLTRGYIMSGARSRKGLRLDFCWIMAWSVGWWSTHWRVNPLRVRRNGINHVVVKKLRSCSFHKKCRWSDDEVVLII